jgi:manganese peroxidase
MHPLSFLVLAISVHAAQAFKVPGLKRDIAWPSLPSVFPSWRPGKRDACPAVWSDVSSELTSMFSGIASCTDDAMAAIRLAFHDCYPGPGGCDGSIILAKEYERTENEGLADIATTIQGIAEKYDVGVADTIAFAGGKWFQ